jgi:membrane-bound lytic murein transglycosylase D
MRKFPVLFFINLSALLFIPLMAPTNAMAQGTAGYPKEIGDNRHLATPEGLQNDVKFWERIFGEYGPDECVFHDEWNLDLVYYVAPVPRSRNSDGSRLLKQHLRSIRGALANLEVRGTPSGEFERSIYASIPDRLKNRAFYAVGQTQVRCQRGVEFQKSLALSRQYIPMIKETLREKGLPSDLAYLPHLESGFNRFATSRAGAKGLWQFMPSTARAEGLTVKRNRDLRTDPARSTDAATDHLASIYLRAQSWELAITAYNYGENGVLRAIQKFGPDYMKIRTEHKTRMFGFAARNYYPSFLAARNVAIRDEVRLAVRDLDGSAGPSGRVQGSSGAASTF